MSQPSLSESVTGLALGLAGMALLTGMDAVAKALGAHLPVMEVVIMRYFGAAIILAAYIAATGRPWPERNKLVPHLIRGSLMGLTLFLFFYAVTHLQLAVATALAMVSPVYIALLGAIFLKERLSPRLIGALGLALGGASVIIWDNTGTAASLNGELLAWAAAMAAPITYAVGIVLVKHHVASERPITMVFGQSVVSGVLVLPLALPVIQVPPGDLIWLCVLLGVLGAVGGILLIEGLKRLSASTFALIDYTALIWAALFGMAFFAEVPGGAFWVGGVLIVAACAVGVSAQKQTEAVRTAGTPLD